MRIRMAMMAVGLLAAGVATATAQAAEAPWGADVAEPVALLGRLHRAAVHEVQLGELAEQSASTPEARQYGADLTADFRDLDQRILSLAAGLHISPDQLQVSRGDNVVIMRKDTGDYTRLANEHGQVFDRDFWVTVADAQARESDLLAATATREPALTDLVSQMSRLYDRSSRRALAAAQVDAHGSTTETTPANAPAGETPPAEAPPTETPPAETPAAAGQTGR